MLRVERQAKPSPGDVDEFTEALILRHRGLVPAGYFRVDTELAQRRYGVVRGRAVGPLDAVKVLPQRVERGERVGLGEVDDDPAPRVRGKRPHEGREVRRVVEDVPADHDVDGLALLG